MSNEPNCGVGHGRFTAGPSGSSEERRCLLYMSPDHSLEGAVAGEAEVVGAALGYGGVSG